MAAVISIEKKKGLQTGPPVFSILIPSWNNLAYLQCCINSILKNAHFPHQIIIHVNEGSDGTLDWIRSQPGLDYTWSAENIGICYALNAASALAETDYIMYMNDDMYVCPGWDLALYEEIKKIGHPNFFLSATMIEPYFSNNPCVIVKNFGEDLAGFRETELLDAFSSLPMNDWQGATWPPNIVHKSTWELVGGYSIEFSPGMGSDPDFSMKLWAMGVRLFMGVSKSRVYHFGCKSTGRVKKNDGAAGFFNKWRMPSSTFTTHYLRRGEVFDGPLVTPALPGWLSIKNFFKRLKAAFID